VLWSSQTNSELDLSEIDLDNYVYNRSHAALLSLIISLINDTLQYSGPVENASYFTIAGK
jgi:hypothetical protein